MVKNFGIYVTVFTLLFVFILNIFEKEAKVTTDFDLNIMNEVMKHNGQMTGWSLFAREELPDRQTIHDLEMLMEKWKKRFPQFLWTKKVNSDRMTISGTVSDNTLHYVENLQIVANLKEQNIIQGFIMYELNGTKWNNEVKNEIHGKIELILGEIFQDSTTFFSCIKGEFDGNIDEVIVKKSQKIVDSFNGEIIEKLEEKNFTSLTVHSPFFSHDIQTENGPFNMQIALRENGIDNKTTYIIGTPIITIEY